MEGCLSSSRTVHNTESHCHHTHALQFLLQSPQPLFTNAIPSLLSFTQRLPLPRQNMRQAPEINWPVLEGLVYYWATIDPSARPVSGIVSTQCSLWAEMFMHDSFVSELTGSGVRYQRGNPHTCIWCMGTTCIHRQVLSSLDCRSNRRPRVQSLSPRGSLISVSQIYSFTQWSSCYFVFT